MERAKVRSCINSSLLCVFVLFVYPTEDAAATYSALLRNEILGPRSAAAAISFVPVYSTAASTANNTSSSSSSSASSAAAASGVGPIMFDLESANSYLSPPSSAAAAAVAAAAAAGSNGAAAGAAGAGAAAQNSGWSKKGTPTRTFRFASPKAPLPLDRYLFFSFFELLTFACAHAFVYVCN